MKRAPLFVLAAAAFAAAVPGRPAAAKELAGVNMPETISVGDKTLKLNGVGLRKKVVFKVYVGGLYLETPSKDAAAILASDQAKAVRMTFLRDVSKSQLQDAFVEGFEANAKEKAASQKAAIEKLYGLLVDVKETQTLSFSYLPGKGTTVALGDKALGVIEGREFSEALFSLWLGPKPPSEDLKKGMLG
ncbi:MAG TPA: chalcone isomerase family protein [Thermoanaerobaculia bacterium]|nr:chalcone isomerase family protein [Thermoanaerobaculia bacterium]